MADKCTTAVILCAGRGTRLGELTESCPKCLLNIDGKSILEWAIESFLEYGVERFVVVVGYRSYMVVDVAKKVSRNVIPVTNTMYATTNTLVSLWCARDYLDNGFWLLNGDVLFDPLSLQRLSDVEFSAIGVIPASCGEEEVKAKVNYAGRVIALSKNVSSQEAIGEFIGLAKFEKDFAHELMVSLNEWQHRPGVERQYFEAAVEMAMRVNPLYIANLAGLNCIEIDTPEDYFRAQQLVGNNRV
jgi:choline kinase